MENVSLLLSWLIHAMHALGLTNGDGSGSNGSNDDGGDSLVGGGDGGDGT